ncbi:YhgE/Pip domain-containing protein [Ruania albidiflava]|uniref:YhgE/Pip domain-containing protein n=1 Tax=Ruania albidiflava TaxID=366586 RepID=UPI0003B40307|nr:YhgE/Pip domain-containing protein [Ruania albidiflava]
MRTLRLARAEITRHKGFLPTLAVLFLVIVPCLYGALYLWSNWDPYGTLEDVPVAVVNLDEPVTVDGTEVAAGDELVETMLEDPIFGFAPTDATDAADGLAEGRYYMTIIIPEDFSANLASGADGTPHRAEVQMRRDDANGYVVGIMAESVQAELHQQINVAATSAYFESVYGELDQLRDGLTQADDGAHQLSDGLVDAKSGSAELADGLADAESGSQELADGLVDASDGAAQLSDGASQVAGGTQQVADVVNPLADEVVPRIPDVADGAASVSDSVASVTDLVASGSDSLSTRTDEVDDALAALVEEHPELADDQAFADLQEAAGRVSDRTGEIDDTLQGVNDDAQQVSTDAQNLLTAVPDLQNEIRTGQANINELNDGAHQVADGAAELASQLPEARDGAAELADGISDAATGSAELADGIADASSGADDLADGLDQLVAAVPALDPDTRERNAAVLGDPTDVTLAVDNPADVYGRGLAPFFFAISLWVFGIVVFLVLRPTTGRAVASTASPVRMALVGWLPVATVGLIGAWLLLAVSELALGLDVVDPLGAFAMVTLATLVFTLIAHLARSALGLVGSAVLLVALMLQLTSSGGIYPVETLPSVLRAIHPYLPMTYLVDGLRVVFTGGLTAHLVRDAIVLGAVGVVAFIGTCLVMARKRTWALHTLHPALEG